MAGIHLEGITLARAQFKLGEMKQRIRLSLKPSWIGVEDASNRPNILLLGATRAATNDDTVTMGDLAFSPLSPFHPVSFVHSCAPLYKDGFRSSSHLLSLPSIMASSHLNLLVAHPSLRPFRTTARPRSASMYDTSSHQRPFNGSLPHSTQPSSIPHDLGTASSAFDSYLRATGSDHSSSNDHKSKYSKSSKPDAAVPPPSFLPPQYRSQSQISLRQIQPNPEVERILAKPSLLRTTPTPRANSRMNSSSSGPDSITAQVLAESHSSDSSFSTRDTSQNRNIKGRTTFYQTFATPSEPSPGPKPGESRRGVTPKVFQERINMRRLEGGDVPQSVAAKTLPRLSAVGYASDTSDAPSSCKLSIPHFYNNPKADSSSEEEAKSESGRTIESVKSGDTMAFAIRSLGPTSTPTIEQLPPSLSRRSVPQPPRPSAKEIAIQIAINPPPTAKTVAPAEPAVISNRRVPKYKEDSLVPNRRAVQEDISPANRRSVHETPTASTPPSSKAPLDQSRPRRDSIDAIDQSRTARGSQEVLDRSRASRTSRELVDTSNIKRSSKDSSDPKRSRRASKDGIPVVSTRRASREISSKRSSQETPRPASKRVSAISNGSSESTPRVSSRRISRNVDGNNPAKLSGSVIIKPSRRTSSGSSPSSPQNDRRMSVVQEETKRKKRGSIVLVNGSEGSSPSGTRTSFETAMSTVEELPVAWEVKKTKHSTKKRHQIPSPIFIGEPSPTRRRMLRQHSRASSLSSPLSPALSTISAFSTVSTIAPIVGPRPPSEKELRRRRFLKLTKTLGEDIPPELLVTNCGGHQVRDSLVLSGGEKAQRRNSLPIIDPLMEALLLANQDDIMNNPDLRYRVTGIPPTRPTTNAVSSAVAAGPNVLKKQNSLRKNAKVNGGGDLRNSMAEDSFTGHGGVVNTPITFAPEPPSPVKLRVETVISDPVPYFENHPFRLVVEDADAVSNPYVAAFSEVPRRNRVSREEIPWMRASMSLPLGVETPFIDYAFTMVAGGNISGAPSPQSQHLAVPVDISDPSGVYRREKRQGWSGEWNQPHIQDVIEKLRNL
ncbi:hypothetical protein FA15DRAFT_694371 [Coprinopsis marcescibilis]|uniref:Uncharacterized protein n=1 Tax=Coprinopsis marcescibilis TaxID=230819 RepID=A0A5C3KV12_COPMA|nr:hypothetical protein FA15DRAFT_694371 [Coprinopsis marcescibilis]